VDVERSKFLLRVGPPHQRSDEHWDYNCRFAKVRLFVNLYQGGGEQYIQVRGWDVLRR
jgi:hypothetical protein